MKPTHLIAGPVVDCIADGREPTVAELFQVAERIWTDAGPACSAFSWAELPADSAERLATLRAAQAALRGAE